MKITYQHYNYSPLFFLRFIYNNSCLINLIQNLNLIQFAIKFIIISGNAIKSMQEIQEIFITIFYTTFSLILDYKML